VRSRARVRASCDASAKSLNCSVCHRAFRLLRHRVARSCDALDALRHRRGMIGRRERRWIISWKWDRFARVCVLEPRYRAALIDGDALRARHPALDPAASDGSDVSVARESAKRWLRSACRLTRGTRSSRSGPDRPAVFADVTDVRQETHISSDSSYVHVYCTLHPQTEISTQIAAAEM